MKTKRLMALVMALALCLTAVLTGCGGKTTPADDGAPKHINAALYWFGSSLDPATEWDGWTTCRAGITETLVTVNEKYEIVPLLADSWEHPDGNTWVLHVRDGVTFHNGKAVDGAAVKASFERAMKMQERAVTAAKIESIEADGQNVTIKTTEPFGAFLANISEPMYSIVDVDAGTDFATAPVATGPFKVTGFEVNSYIELERYEGYWNGASDVDTMTIRCVEDDGSRGRALQSGELDIVQRVAWTDIPTFEADSNFQVFDTQGARTRILSFNFAKPRLADVNVRKALAACINYEKLVSVLGSGVSVAGAPYPASAPYGYKDLERQAYNAEAAAKYLADSGYTEKNSDGYLVKDGEELMFTVHYSNNSFTTMLEAVQSMAKEVGIHLELKMVDSTSELGENGDFDILCGNTQVLSTGDPQWYLDSFFKTGSANNVTKYSNTELDAVIDQLAQTFDIAEREKLTIEAEKIMLDDCAAIWLVGENNFVVASSKVQNVVPYPIDYYFVDNGLTINK